MNDDLLKEARRIDYRLRSTFFYRKLHELGFMDFAHELDALVKIGESCKWTERGQWGISQGAWEYVAGSQLSPLRVFCHPRVIIEQPRLIAYYRNIAALSQKAVQTLAFNVKPFELGRNREDLSYERALLLCQLFNTHVSTIIESTLTFSQRDLDALLFASAGAQINGSWLNAIGSEAEMVVKRLLSSFLVKRGLVVGLLDKKGHSLTLDEVEDLIRILADIRAMRLCNGTSMVFGAEPDIALLAPTGQTIAVIEVKGGKDPAGALEQYGAAKKSFEKTLEDNLDAITIYLASCITEEVERRLAEDTTVQQVFNLTILLGDETQRNDFLAYIGKLLET
ncbi:MAG: XcyI family restriction endonuclease [Chloroflexi bacterium]|nr:XcyI family restriction endonuclease [Chloroflexota bacterium]